VSMAAEPSARQRTHGLGARARRKFLIPWHLSPLRVLHWGRGNRRCTKDEDFCHGSRDRSVSRRQCVRAECPCYRASRSTDRGTRVRWTTPSARLEDDHRPGARRGSTSRKSFGGDWGSNGQPKPRYFGRASRASGQLTHRLLAKVCAGVAPFWPLRVGPGPLAGVSFVPFAAGWL
jgi:hypothetical protein